VLVAVGAEEVRVTVETAARTLGVVRRSARLAGKIENSMVI